MKKINICLFFMFCCLPAVFAADLFDLRVFPCFESRTVHFDGVIVTSRYKENAISRKNHLSGLIGKWMPSGTVTIEASGRSINSTVKNGEFSGIIQVNDISSFTLDVKHAGKSIHKETFLFPENPDYIVVSDIDDTILVTEVTSKLKMSYNSLIKSIRDRKPIANTPEFYQMLKNNGSPTGKPHFVYLSSSPAFLSRSLKNFICRNDFPQGTLVLKKSLTSGGHDEHKSGWLKYVSEKYPGKPLLLIGDSGEKDPFIYQSFAKNTARPDLVKGIIIHEVTGRPTRIEALDQIKQLLAKDNIHFIYWNCINNLKESLKNKSLIK